MNQAILFRRQYWKSSHITLLFLLAILCFWPISFGIFSAKNDNITAFLPVRFHISEALRNGSLPLWSPYMYLGYPIHGDMQGGAWNPVVWIVSLFGRYNVYSIHAEIIFYIFLSGCGMYRLLGERINQSSIKLACAAAYMLCGYVSDVSGSNIPFLAAAAYIPFVFAYFHQLFVYPSFYNSIKAGVATTLLFVSAYPSFFILTAYILLLALLVVIVKNHRNKNFSTKNILTYNAIAILFFVCLSAPAILSYIQILPFYQRAEGVNLSQAMVNSFHPSCTLSFIFPTASFKNPLSSGTDLSSRNAYFTCILLLFTICYLQIRKTIFYNFIVAGIIFFFLFSLGDHTPVRGWCYKLFPLMDTFRHPSNGRLFLIIGSIVIAAYAYQSFLNENISKKMILMAGSVIMGGILICISVLWKDFSLAEKFSSFKNTGGNLRHALKDFFDIISFHELIVLNGMVQLIFLGWFLYLFSRQKINIQLLSILIIANSFLFAQFSLPYTVVSKTSPSAINQLLKQFPQGYPKPDSLSIETNSKNALANFDTLGISSLYDKKISLTNVVYTPTFMLPLDKAFKDSNTRKLMFANPYAYFAREVVQPSLIDPSPGIAYSVDQRLLNIKMPGEGQFVLENLSANRFQFFTQNKADAIFILQQVHLPGWVCTTDGQNTEIINVNSAFMGIRVEEGNHRIVFEYQPAGIGAALTLSLLTIIMAIFLLLNISIRAIRK